jgi:hypothetical protein
MFFSITQVSLSIQEKNNKLIEMAKQLQTKEVLLESFQKKLSKMEEISKLESFLARKGK